MSSIDRNEPENERCEATSGPVEESGEAEYLERAAKQAAAAKRSDKQEKRSTSQAIVDMAVEMYVLGIDQDGRPFAVPKGSHVGRALKGGRDSVRQELAAQYYSRTGKVASQNALTEAIEVLTFMCEKNEPRDVSLRSARTSNNVIYLDLGDVDESIVMIEAGRWIVLGADDDVPVIFRRTALTASLPVPVRGGSLDPLWEFVNVSNPREREVLVGWLVAALTLVNLPCPILAVMGEQGATKTSAMKRLSSLFDPTTAPVRRPPDSAEKLLFAAQGSRTTGFDNLSSIPRWLSDGLCRIVTGDADADRALYTDDSLRVVSTQGVVSFTAIDVGTLAGDLADRCTWVSLEVMPASKRRSDRDLNDAWHAVYPILVGALLDQAAQMLTALPQVQLTERPRMADFAETLAALDLATGSRALDYYIAAQESVASEIVNTDRFMVELASRVVTRWSGTGSELRRLLPDHEDDKHWPKPRGMNAKLARIAPDLRKAGWVVEETKADPIAKRAATWLLEPPSGAPSSGSDEED